MSLPSNGQADWGTPLNNYITNTVLAEANLAEQQISTHVVANDPHGDRAYALGLVTPITSGVNGPNGYVKLDSNGKLPTSATPTGNGLTTIFDVVKDYSAPVATAASSAVDCSTQIQAALTAAGNDLGGIVWVGAGYYGIGTSLVISSGTRLVLAPGAVLMRVVSASTGVAPTALLTNFSTTASGGNDYIQIDGGQWNFANVASPAGAAIVLAQSSGFVIANATFTTPSGSPAVLLSSVVDGSLYGNKYILGGTSTTGWAGVSQQTSSTISGFSLPGGMTSTTPCNRIAIQEYYARQRTYVSTGSGPNPTIPATNSVITGSALSVPVYTTGATVVCELSMDLEFQPSGSNYYGAQVGMDGSTQAPSGGGIIRQNTYSGARETIVGRSVYTNVAAGTHNFQAMQSAAAGSVALRSWSLSVTVTEAG